MSEQTSQEPTMEEILASIRRIISEDDAPAEPEAQAAPEPAPEPEPEPQVAEFAPEPQEEVLSSPTPDEDDVLELTDRIREQPAEIGACGENRCVLHREVAILLVRLLPRHRVVGEQVVPACRGALGERGMRLSRDEIGPRGGDLLVELGRVD